ncbi:sigma factor-like helix-turn-helix DNA-binding protein [Streptomyces sp. NPDC046831]|uniref:sigma factor-like helix-turn-helix DNA-binding protein n=1 Tax=Streptomyces sp. NPDC046831 TaxID=3154805 RepID=UPI0033EBDA77
MNQSPAKPLPPPAERRRLRQSAALTQHQVASQVAVALETLRAWEAGRSVPRGREREEYADLLASIAEAERQQTRAPGGLTARGGPGASHGAPVPAEASGATAMTPAQAFDTLYAFCAPALVRQAYLLTGRRDRARRAVERAFQSAWQRWPEVARDPDPAGWVRAAVYDCALSPWNRLRPPSRAAAAAEPPPADPADRALLRALLDLPPSYRRALVLYDGVGLDLPETAAESEASTPATANRLMHAREAVAARLPELADPAQLHRRLVRLASGDQLRTDQPPCVRTAGERRTRFWARAAIAFTVTIVGATALTLRTAPTHYEAPVAPGHTVRGVPPRAALGPLSPAQTRLRARLKADMAGGPERVLPEAR